MAQVIDANPHRVRHPCLPARPRPAPAEHVTRQTVPDDLSVSSGKEVWRRGHSAHGDEPDQQLPHVFGCDDDPLLVTLCGPDEHPSRRKVNVRNQDAASFARPKPARVDRPEQDGIRAVRDDPPRVLVAVYFREEHRELVVREDVWREPVALWRARGGDLVRRTARCVDEPCQEAEERGLL